MGLDSRESDFVSKSLSIAGASCPSQMYRCLSPEQEKVETLLTLIKLFYPEKNHAMLASE